MIVARTFGLLIPSASTPKRPMMAELRREVILLHLGRVDGLVICQAAT